MISGTYPPAHCGVGDYTALLCDNLAAKGVDVTVLTSSFLGTPPRSTGPTVRPVVGGWSPWHAPEIVGHLRDSRAEIYHFQTPTAVYGHRLMPHLLIPFHRRLVGRGKVVVTLHEIAPLSIYTRPIKSTMKALRAWWSSQGADAAVVTGESDKASLGMITRLPGRVACEVIPIGSNIPVSLLTSEDAREVRQQIGVADRSTLIAYFGFINPSKGFEDALDVVRLLGERGADPRLVVLSELKRDDPYHRSLSRRVTAGGLRDRVKVMGYLDRNRVADLLAASDACLFPFRGGLHPKNTSLLAATVQGAYVVTTDRARTGYSEHENIHYARPGDVIGMADAISLAWQRPRRLAHRNSASWGLIADKHVELYERLLRHR